MFWKRFYFVVILLSCNCFFLTCEWLCELFGFGSSKKESGTKSELNISGNNRRSGLENNDFYCSDNNLKDVDFSELGLLGELGNYDCGFSCVFLCAIDCAVGKTSILKMAKENNFKEIYTDTTGVDFTSFFFKTTNNNLIIKLESWDTASKKANQKFVESFCSNKNAIIFVYDIYNAKSFEELGNRIKEVENIASKNTLFFLLGNKLDLVEENKEPRQVETNEAKNFAEKNDLIFLGECSAKNNIYIPNENTCYKEGELEKGKCPDCVMGIFKDILYNIVNKQKSQGE